MSRLEVITLSSGEEAEEEADDDVQIINEIKYEVIDVEDEPDYPKEELPLKKRVTTAISLEADLKVEDNGTPDRPTLKQYQGPRKRIAPVPVCLSPAEALKLQVNEAVKSLFGNRPTVIHSAPRPLNSKSPRIQLPNPVTSLEDPLKVDEPNGVIKNHIPVRTYKPAKAYKPSKIVPGVQIVPNPLATKTYVIEVPDSPNKDESEEAEKRKNGCLEETKDPEPVYLPEPTSPPPDQQPSCSVDERHKELFIEFMELCRSKSASTEMNMSQQRLWRLYQTTEPQYLASNIFKKTVKKLIAKVQSGSSPFYQMKVISDEMKCNPVVTDPRIVKLQRLLSEVNKRIKKLDEKEVGSSDDEDSSYLRAARYRKRAVEIYNKICELSGRDPDADRKYLKKVIFVPPPLPELAKWTKKNESPAREIARALSRYYNKTREFPDFLDVKKLVNSTVQRMNITLTGDQLHFTAQKMFTAFGDMLKKRRQADSWSIAKEYFPDEIHDPAEEDSELESKLAHNHVVFHRREKEVLDEFVAKQLEQSSKKQDHRKKKGDDTNSSDSSSSGVTSSEEEEEEVRSKSKKRGKRKRWLSSSDDSSSSSSDRRSRKKSKRRKKEKAKKKKKRKRLLSSSSESSGSSSSGVGVASSVEVSTDSDSDSSEPPPPVTKVKKTQGPHKEKTEPKEQDCKETHQEEDGRSSEPSPGPHAQDPVVIQQEVEMQFDMEVYESGGSESGESLTNAKILTPRKNIVSSQ